MMGVSKTEDVNDQRRSRHWTLSLRVNLQVLACLLLLAGVSGPLEAKTFIVTSTLDEIDAALGDGVCATASGDCTLRAAIQETNLLPGPDTIKLKAGLHMLTIPGRSEDGCATGDLDITDDLTLIGMGAKNTFINGGGIDRVFHIVLPVSVKISQLTVQNGIATEGRPVYGDAAGGGILNNAGSLTLEKSDVSNNSAIKEGVAVGGGIYSQSGQLTIKGCTLSQNWAIGSYSSGTGSGGGIYIAGGTVVITTSTINRNSTGGYFASLGGGIYSGNAALSLVQSTLSNNFVFSTGYPALGGGLYTASSQVTVRGSTISYNSANGASYPGLGGGICASNGELTLAQTTVSYNSCSGYGQSMGGGIYADGNITLRGASKIMRNVASTEGGGIFVNSGTPDISPDSIITKNIPNNLVSR
jgi:CSLREA domain-containing protein